MKAKPWTKAHQIEAARWLLRAAEVAATAGDLELAAYTLLELSYVVFMRERVVTAMVDDMHLSAKEAARAMRRIDDFAEGRRVRETWYRVANTMYKQRESAKTDAARDGFPLVTVHRTRRVG